MKKLKLCLKVLTGGYTVDVHDPDGFPVCIRQTVGVTACYYVLIDNHLMIHKDVKQYDKTFNMYYDVTEVL
jgi:hypothetical protein